MKNIKSFAVATEGNMKRIVIAYDEINDTGKATNPNQKKNRFVVDEQALEAIYQIESYAKSLIEE